MQWLTAVLAFATTMLIFAVIVTILIETVHRLFGSRSMGLKRLIGHVYDQVIEPHLKVVGAKLSRDEFVEMMSAVRAPVAKETKDTKSTEDQTLTEDQTPTENGKYTRWSFKLLSRLPTETFMERLGSSAFAKVVEGKSEADSEKLLKDIAQKFEAFGRESSIYFESKARLNSVIVAIIIAYAFYVHPYDLIQTFMQNSAVAATLARLADEPMEKYESLVKATEELKKQNGAAAKPLTAAEFDDLVNTLKNDLQSARTEVGRLSTASAPVGWPTDPDKFGEKLLYQRDDFRLAFYYPSRMRDLFWLVIGGLMIGLGAPFWSKLIKQLTEAKKVSQSLNDILKPQGPGADPGDNTAITSEAFRVAAAAARLQTPVSSGQSAI